MSSIPEVGRFQPAPEPEKAPEESRSIVENLKRGGTAESCLNLFRLAEGLSGVEATLKSDPMAAQEQLVGILRSSTDLEQWSPAELQLLTERKTAVDGLRAIVSSALEKRGGLDPRVRLALDVAYLDFEVRIAERRGDLRAAVLQDEQNVCNYTAIYTPQLPRRPVTKNGADQRPIALP